jgi:hypothetical protein
MGMMNKKQNKYKKEDFLPPQNYYAARHSYEKMHEDVGHNFWSGVKYIIMLSFMLWWLPVIGQMVAGYIGGRRAGSPIRGTIAALIPIDLLLVFNILLATGYMANGDQIYAAPGTISSIVATNAPFFFPYLDFSFLYLANIFSSFQAVLAFEPSVYFIVVVFAGLGGLMADQNRKEIIAMAKHYATQSHHHYQSPASVPMPEPISPQYVMVSRYPHGNDGKDGAAKAKATSKKVAAKPKARKKPKVSRAKAAAKPRAAVSLQNAAPKPNKERAVAVMPKGIDTL